MRPFGKSFYRTLFPTGRKSPFVVGSPAKYVTGQSRCCRIEFHSDHVEALPITAAQNGQYYKLTTL
jgi:hypothetical protein